MRLTVIESTCKSIGDLAGDAFWLLVSVHGERGDMGSSILCSPRDCFSSEEVELRFVMIGLCCFCVGWKFSWQIGSGGMKTDVDKCSIMFLSKPLFLFDALTLHR